MYALNQKKNKINKTQISLVPKLNLEKAKTTQNNHTRFNSERISPFKEGLDYTFRNKRENLSSMEKQKVDDLIFDLEHTWTLNADLLSNMSEESPNLNVDEKHTIIQNIKKNKSFV